MLLNELFASQMPWKIREHRPNYFDATFMINNIKYIFRASAYLNNGESIGKLTEWDVEFYPDLDIPNKEKYKILKLGNSIQVFANVVDVMREFIKEYKPHIITFSAEEPTRKKLYMRLVKNLLPNWEVEQSSSTQFTIIDPW